MDPTLSLSLELQRMRTPSCSPSVDCSSSSPLPVLSPSVVAASLQALDADTEQLPLLIEQQLRDLVGEPLAREDLDNVQLEPLRTCLCGEIVAVDYGGQLIYAKVMEEEDPSSSGEVKVQVSKSCIRWYAVSTIYFFRVQKQVWTGDSNEKREASPFSVVAEVNTLLARLNVSLSTSYEGLLEEILRLQVRATLADEDRQAALMQLEQALSAQRDAEKALVCVVCLVNTVDRVLVPCGHSYCAACVKRLHRGACPVCRQESTHSVVFRIS